MWHVHSIHNMGKSFTHCGVCNAQYGVCDAQYGVCNALVLGGRYGIDVAPVLI